MAINITIYKNSTGKTATVTVDFKTEIVTPGIAGNCQESFFKFFTSAKDTDGLALPVKYAADFSDLVLNGAKQRKANTAADYASINAMVEDYVYDYVNGHDEDLYTSGCTEQLAMLI